MSRRNALPEAGLTPQIIERFRKDVERLGVGDRGALAVAVSGGPDSLALLLLAERAFPGRLLALTADHGLRPESAGEALHVGRICERLGVSHRILPLPELAGVGANIQAAARDARYAAMELACAEQGIGWLMTGHHADDQAETLLMRLARGAGVAGLSGVRARRTEGGVALIRPLLGWRKVELQSIVTGAGLDAVDDPSNRSLRYDRTTARILLSEAKWLDATRIAGSAAHLADAEEALEWVSREAWRGRSEAENGRITVDLRDLPREITRRLVVHAVLTLAPDAALDGPSVDRLIDRCLAGQRSTLAGIQVAPAQKWTFSVAPVRRNPKS